MTDPLYLANAMIKRFDVPYPAPEQGVVARFQLQDDRVLAVERQGNRVSCRLDQIESTQGWVALHPGLRVLTTHMHSLVAGDQKPATWEMVIETTLIPLCLRVECAAPWRSSLVFPRGL